MTIIAKRQKLPEFMLYGLDSTRLVRTLFFLNLHGGIDLRAISSANERAILGVVYMHLLNFECESTLDYGCNSILH